MKYLLITAVLALSSLTARSELFTFYAISSNDSSGYAQFVGESQLYMDVTLLGMGQVSLVFENSGSENSVITQIYCDFAPELSLNLVAINNGDGVEFQTNPVSPKNLPAGQGMDNVFTSDLAVSSKNPSPQNGINPYDSLELIMSYDDSYDFLGSLGNGALRVGLHVQGFEGGYSESFVSAVPEPGTLPLLFVGSFALRWLRIKKSKRGKQDNSFTPCLEESEPNELGWVEIKTRKTRNKPRSRYEAAIRKATAC